MNKKLATKTLSLLMLSLLVSDFAQAKSKKTVGELLSQVSLQNRGGKLSSSEKRKITIPKHNEIQFEKNQVEHNLEFVKPIKSYEIIQSENISQTAEYEKVLDEQIQELFKLTKKFKDSNNRGELWLRLAELYVEKGSLIDYRRQKDFDKKLALYNQGKTRVKPELETEEAKAYFKKSIQLYEWFEKDFPRDPKVAQALYFLGFNYFELGMPQKGEKYYTQLADKYPQSPFVDESNFALGEYNFEKENWKEAYKRYSPVIKNKRHNLNAMATYKGAWCLYRLNRHNEALKYMEHIIKQSRNSDDRDSKKQIRAKLEVEALKDIVVFYAAAGDADNSVEYFNQLVGPQANGYLEKLAYYYLDKGQKEAAHKSFQYLISLNPNSPKAFEYQYQIVQVYFYSKNSPAFKTELYKWIKDYGPSTTWYQANQGNAELIDNSMKLREKTLRNWTLQQHQTAQNSRTKNSQSLALEGYRLYLNEFVNFPQSSDMHFYYGELLYDMKNYDEAGIQYKWIVDNAPQSKFYENAASNLLISVEKSLPDEKELARKNSKNVEPIPLSPTVERFIKASNWYIEKLPNSKKVPEIRFRQGRLMYQHNYFEDANKVFKEIVTKYPKTKYAEYSANLMLDIFNLKKDYVGLEYAASELLKNESLASTKAGEEIKDVLEKASFKKAQDLEQESKFLESADTFVGFAKQNPKSSLAILALYNAGVNYEKSSQNEKAKNSYLAVINSNQDKKDLKYKAKLYVAKLYQEAALFDESIKLYKQLIKEDPKSNQNQNFLYNIALMKEAQGLYPQAIKDYEEYYQGVKKWQEKLELMFVLAELYRKSNQLSKSQDKYKEYIDNNPGNAEKLIEAYYWMGHIYELKGSSQSYQWEDKLLAVQRRLADGKKNVGNKWAAMTKLKRAKETYGDLKEIKIPNQPEKQKKAVDEKISLLNKLNKDLNEVVRLNSPDEIISSLSLLGDANEHMANAIMNSPVPKGLGADLEKQYRESLPKLAEPFLNRAKESHKLAVDRGFEFETYNADFDKSLNYMNKNDAKKYYNSSEIKFDTKFINWMSL
jgi:tetratricopeptide (TPR) repeat protein